MQLPLMVVLLQLASKEIVRKPCIVPWVREILIQELVHWVVLPGRYSWEEVDWAYSRSLVLAARLFQHLAEFLLPRKNFVHCCPIHLVKHADAGEEMEVVEVGGYLSGRRIWEKRIHDIVE